MHGPNEFLTRSQVITFAAAAAALARCTAAPSVTRPDPASLTPEDRAVRATLERFWAASNAEDLPGILIHVTEDARVDSIVAGGKVSKAEYAVALRAWLANPGSLEFRSDSRVERVTFPRASRVVVDAQTSVHRSGTLTRQGWTRDRRIEYALEERGGQWLIVESTYTQK